MNVGLEEAKRWQFVCVCTCVCVRGHDISHTGSLAHVSPSDSDTHAEIDKLTHTLTQTASRLLSVASDTEYI